MAGRKPIPIEIQKVKGNPGKRPLPETVDVPLMEKYREPPAHVKAQKYGKLFWQETLPLLIAMGVMTANDVTALSHYCIALSIHREASEALAKEGHTYKSIVKTFGKGKKQQTVSTVLRKSPHLEIVSTYSQLAQRFAVEFGLTPSSRSKVSFRAPPAPESKLSRYTNHAPPK